MPISRGRGHPTAYPLRRVTLASVTDLSEERGLVFYELHQAWQRAEALTIPWNHLGDKLIKLWREVEVDRLAGRTSRVLVIENPKISDATPFSGCKLLRR